MVTGGGGVGSDWKVVGTSPAVLRGLRARAPLRVMGAVTWRKPQV